MAELGLVADVNYFALFNIKVREPLVRLLDEGINVDLETSNKVPVL